MKKKYVLWTVAAGNGFKYEVTLYEGEKEGIPSYKTLKTFNTKKEAKSFLKEKRKGIK